MLKSIKTHWNVSKKCLVVLPSSIVMKRGAPSEANSSHYFTYALDMSLHGNLDDKHRRHLVDDSMRCYDNDRYHHNGCHSNHQDTETHNLVPGNPGHTRSHL